MYDNVIFLSTTRDLNANKKKGGNEFQKRALAKQASIIPPKIVKAKSIVQVEGPSKSDELWTEIVEKMKYEFEITKKNIKKVAIDYAVNYFKEKSFELSNLYTQETIKLLN